MGKKSKKKRQICHTQADGSRAMGSRPASMEVLSTWSSDSAPSLLFTADTERLVINIPEGWQRLCVEQKIKIGKVDAVCLTHLGPSAVGGLPHNESTTAELLSADGASLSFVNGSDWGTAEKMALRDHDSYYRYLHPPARRKRRKLHNVST